MTHAQRPAAVAGASPGAAAGALFGLFVKLVVTPVRILGFGLLGALAVLLAIIASNGDNPDVDGVETLAVFGLQVVLPVASLAIASASLGTLNDDRTLVYIWLRPIPRWIIATAALAASVAVVLPLVGVPLVVAAVASGVSGLPAATALAVVVGAVGYCGLFVGAGAWLKRPFLWGLGYILVWEGFISAAGGGTIWVALRSYTQSHLVEATGVRLDEATHGVVAASLGPLVIGVIGTAVATWRLHRAEVD